MIAGRRCRPIWPSSLQDVIVASGLLDIGSLPGIDLYTKWAPLADGGVAAVRDWVRVHPDAAVVVFDTLDDVLGATREGRLSAADAAAFARLVKVTWDCRLALFAFRRLSFAPTATQRATMMDQLAQAASVHIGVVHARLTHHLARTLGHLWAGTALDDDLRYPKEDGG
jgi:hypothetical protein